MNMRLALVARLLIGLVVSTTVAWSKPSNTAQVLNMEEPAFPVSMLVKGVTSGEVQIVISLDPAGKLTDWLMVSYTRPEFADAVVRAVKASRFQPILVNGTACNVRLPLSINFEARGVVVSQTILDTIESRLDLATGGPSRIRKTSTARELDSPVKPKHLVSPLYPADFAADKTGATVVLDFFIDEKGKVRMPTLEEGDQVAFAQAAAAALEEWQFDPPTRRGEPVTVRVKQKFVFAPKV